MLTIVDRGADLLVAGGIIGGAQGQQTKGFAVDRQERYSDRLAAASYSSDVQCQLRLVRDSRVEHSQPVEGRMSKRLLARLKHLGLAYEVSLLKRLPSPGVEVYSDIQVEELEDELAFLFSVVSDDVLLAAISPLREMIRVATHDPGGWVLRIESP
jgi:hypothetical protein